ncbi:hypothetical protein ACFOZ1_11910 [Gracilibacillus marinus]|jgi:hypothetical protein|uniref:DUF3667 domain-containing protein n=1 Tax=Gracilibacillus marinus TaxID=630535 RepID=A0ABV8VY16_9BACI
MDAERKKVIINEIKYWKDHRLLPTHYCDFLLALYTEGQGDEEIEERTKSPYYLFFYFFNTLTLFITLLTINLYESLIIQALSIVFVIIINVVFIMIFKKNVNLRDDYAVMILFVNFLFATSLMLMQYIIIPIITYSWILLNSVCWIVFGKWKKQFFLQAAGVFVLIIGIILIGFYYL